ncbi:MAG TPA: hypothetical protein VFT50_08625 [Baekduia sp.]|nr:hypothetical protein [Baekduia sp.]
MAGPIDLVLLRGMLPDVPLRPGAVVHGRVLDARTLVLEGVRLAAQLPEGVQAGQRLKLRVDEAGRDGLRLHVLETIQPAAAHDPAAAPQVPVTAYAVALPGGAVARVHVEEDGGEESSRRSGAPRRSVVVRYDSPTLGRLDVRLDPGAAAVHVSAGAPAERVRSASPELRDALARVTGGPVQVTVHPRGETLNVRA